MAKNKIQAYDAKYWEQRSMQISNKRFKEVVDFEKELQKVYEVAVQEIETEITSFVSKYATENKLNPDHVKIILGKSELAKYNERMSRLASRGSETGMKAENASRKLSRLEALKNQLKAHAEVISIDQTTMVENFLVQQYQDSFMDNQQAIADGYNVDAIWETPSYEVVAPIVNYPYTGIMFSEAIWKANDKLVNNLTNVLTNGMVKGRDIDKMVSDLRKAMSGSTGEKYSTYDLRRIVRTESAFVQQRAKQDTNEKYGIDKIEIICPNDERSCSLCGNHDGNIINRKEERIGYNAPPFHPNCRCTTAPYVSDEDLEKAEEKFISNFKKQENKVAKEKEKAKEDIIKKPAEFANVESQIMKKRVGNKEFRRRYLDGAKKIIDNAPPNVKQIWNLAEKEIKFGQVGKSAEGCYWLGEVNVNIFEDYEGDAGFHPYDTFFHEIGHCIDEKLGKRYNAKPNGSYKDLSFKTKDWHDTIKEEGNAYVEKVCKKAGAKTEKERKNAVSLAITCRDSEDYASVSDLIEGATEGEYSGGYGHGKKYWKKEKMLPAEAFAEFFSATVLQEPLQLMYMKEVFPKSYKMFEDILEEVLKNE